MPRLYRAVFCCEILSLARFKRTMIFEQSVQREFRQSASSILVVLLAVLVTVTLVRMLDHAASGGIDPGDVLTFLLLSAAGSVPQLLALTAFLAVLLTMTRAFRDQEMAVWFSAGLSLLDWLRPLGRFLMPLVAVSLAFAWGVAPWSVAESERLQAQYSARDESLQAAAGRFRESAGGRRVFFVGQTAQEGQYGPKPSGLAFTATCTRSGGCQSAQRTCISSDCCALALCHLQQPLNPRRGAGFTRTVVLCGWSCCGTRPLCMPCRGTDLVSITFRLAPKARQKVNRVILRGYIARRVHQSIALVLLTLLALFAFFDLVAEMEDVGKGAFRLVHAFAAAGLLLPSRLPELLPVSMLIGTIFALSQFAQNSEFTAMRAAGLKPYRVLVWLALCALPWAGVGLLASEFLSPAGMRQAQALRVLSGEALIDTSSRNGNLGSGLWVRDLLKNERGELLSQRFINIRAAAAEGFLSDVEIVEFDAERRVRRWLFARSARLGASPGLSLEDVREISWQPQPVSRHHASMRWEGGVDQTVIAMAAGRPERMSIAELLRFVRYLRSNQQASERYELALWRRLASPWNALAMLLMALPFAYLQPRSGALGGRIFAGVLIGVVYHLLSSLLG
ncbi:MAG: LPS export ABC transporter permease LptG [Betaproteobacteria bacterium]|nr:LPS export ABC transporter permease LptG [Betaproteobacteria bacterium]